MDAGKRVNQICEEFGIPHKNTGISAIPIQEWKVTPNNYHATYFPFAPQSLKLVTWIEKMWELQFLNFNLRLLKRLQ